MTNPGRPSIDGLERLVDRRRAACAPRGTARRARTASAESRRAGARMLATSPSIGIACFSRVSRRATSTGDFSMSFGPISSRSGTPRSSHSANFQPGVCVALVERDADAAGDELLLDLARLRQHGLPPVVASDRHDHDLVRRDARRQHEAAVVAVRHDDGADEPRRHAPGRAPDVLHRLVARLERDVERLREVLTEVVRRAGLQRAAVAHQRLDRVRAERAGELLAFALAALDDRHRQHRLAHIA